MIIATVAAAIILIALVAYVMPRMRRRRELEQRREGIAGEHRAEAGERHREADEAERQARMAKRGRVEAQMRERRADATERGMGDEPTQLRDDQPMHEPAKPRRFAPAAKTETERAKRRD
jgi:hypothetical protein